MTEFRLKKRVGARAAVEIWEGERLIGAIYPADGAVRIASKYLDSGLHAVTWDPGPASGFVAPSLTVRIVEGS
jgi:hypothetical protein